MQHRQMLLVNPIHSIFPLRDKFNRNYVNFLFSRVYLRLFSKIDLFTVVSVSLISPMVM